MELIALYTCVIGLDVHQAQITACALTQQTDGSVHVEHRQFGGFQRDRKALARAGLLDKSFVPPAKFRELRLVSRQRQNLVGILASEKNRLHKLLTDGGVRLGVVVSDLHGQSARAMVKAIIAGKAPHEVVLLASHRLKASNEEIFDALQGELTENHRFTLGEIMHHIEEIEARIARFDARLVRELHSDNHVLALLQTIPGIDLIGAAMLLVDIGTGMQEFSSPDRLASWVGMCPGNNESAGKRKSGKTRQDNQYVRRLLCEFAHAASRTQSAFTAKFQAIHARRDYKRAITAIGHKILRTIFFMLQNGEHYRDSATDYEALVVKRNAPRWIRSLVKFGFIKPQQA